MNIERPTSNPGLIKVDSVLDPWEVDFAVDYARRYHHYTENSKEESFTEEGATMDKIMNKARDIIKSVMSNQFPDLSLAKFEDSGRLAVRTPGPGMHFHVDGPGDVDRPGHGVKGLAALLYLGEDFEGGELCYPQLDYILKPASNTLIIHRAEEPFEHGVNPIKSGLRMHFSMFAFEKYDAQEIIDMIERRQHEDHHAY